MGCASVQEITTPITLAKHVSQAQDHDTDVLYDADSKQTTARPAVVQKAGTVLFTVQISGIPSDLSQDIQPNLGQNNSSNVIEFSMSQVVQTGVNPLNPWCIKGWTHFYLFTVDNKGDLTRGGRFYLDAWLDAYRSFRKQGALSLVNCYDQAGAVELAASLGVSYESIVWECHQLYGFITQDANRTYFANHAFLSWNPTFTPDANTFSESNNPSNLTGFLAIHACAGRHLGDQERGSWVSPTSYPDSSVYPEGYTSKDTTYWRTRDDKYLLQEHTYQYLDDDKETWKNLTDRHFWTPGITGLSVKTADASFANLHEDPFAGSAITFPTTADFPHPDWVYAGSIGYLEGVFVKHLSAAAASEGFSSWTEMTIPIVNLDNGGRQYEVKLFDSALPAFNFALLKISILPSLDAALSAQKGGAAHIIITSTLVARDFTSVLNNALATPEENQVKIHILQADFTGLIVWQNLLLETSGYVGKGIIQDFVKAMVTKLSENLPLASSDMWQNVFN